ncbi:MAG: WXG100 family type VII secretion target [Eubacterium sp.]
MATAVQLNVSPQDMLVLASLIENDIDEWDGSVQGVYQLHGEMDGMWDGDANDAFNQIFIEDKSKFDRLKEVMRQYAAVIRVAAEAYIQGEDEIKGIVTRR